jgi:hypothetical protein
LDCGQNFEGRKFKEGDPVAIAMKVGDRVTVVRGAGRRAGSTGTVVGISGSRPPFHWTIDFDDGLTGLYRGDELVVSQEG